MIRRSHALAITAVTFLLWALTSSAPAAQDGHGSVTGRVVDQTRQPLAGANIELVSGDDVHTHPALPRSVRVALRVSF
jgi:type 1 fimbria pilin